MSKIKFKNCKRADKSLGETGVWFPYTDDAGEFIGSFKCASFIQGNLRWRNAVDRVQNRLKVSGTKSDNFALDLVLELVLKDWKLDDADGKPVPFNVENARDFLGHEDQSKLLDYIIDKSRDETEYFAPNESEPEKN